MRGLLRRGVRSDEVAGIAAKSIVLEEGENESTDSWDFEGYFPIVGFVRRAPL